MNTLCISPRIVTASSLIQVLCDLLEGDSFEHPKFLGSPIIISFLNSFNSFVLSLCPCTPLLIPSPQSSSHFPPTSTLFLLPTPTHFYFIIFFNMVHPHFKNNSLYHQIHGAVNCKMYLSFMDNKSKGGKCQINSCYRL